MEPQIGSPNNPVRVAIIGSGPSGFYAADALLSQTQFTVEVDIFDRLPTPHGLVRGGVAPDHQKIKNVTAVYDRIAAKPNVRFFGNVEFGRDITHADLVDYYHQIVYAVGAETDKHLNIPGENLAGNHPATEFVGWYNGHPDYRDCVFDLSQETAVIVGVGNVAMDVARILARSQDELAPTDIADYALEALKESKVKNIYVLGRRGIVQAAFTSKELVELGEMTDAKVVAREEDVELDPISREELETTTDRDTVKNVETLKKYVNRPTAGLRPKTIFFRFLTSPTEILGTDRVEKVRIVRNELVRDDKGRVKPQPTDRIEEISAGLVFRSVGYNGVALPDVPFRADWGVIPNEKGRVMQFANGKLGAVVVGEYVAGWIKRGPSGVIGDNRKDSQETVDQMVADLQNGVALTPSQFDRNAIVDLLRARDVFYVTYADWLKLDEIERANGEAAGRVRVKFTRIEDMLDVIKKLQAEPL